LLVATLGFVGAARAATRAVGPGKTYAKPCAAIAAAQDGDVIEIDAGTYSGDVCAIAASNLTLRGVGGRAHLDAAGAAYGGKGTWVIQGANTTVENLEFSGAKVPDMNGAGIRQEGHGLVVRNCFFHDNEDGILSGGGGEILIESSEFANNGAGDGFSHNMYIGHELKFTLRASYSHGAKIGHLVKSRADQNVIVANRLMDEADGTSSYTIDLPNGGTSYVIGNLIQQGPKGQNSTIVAYAEEGATNSSADLYVVSNTFVNDRTDGVFLAFAPGAAPGVVRDNIFLGGGTVSTQASMTMAALKADGNYVGGDPMLVDRAAYDYHLRPGSPCVNAGVDPGAAGAMSLAPQLQYVHPAMSEARVLVGTIDIGAYELGGGVPATDGGSAKDAPTDGAATPDGAGAAGAGAAGAAGAGAAGMPGGAAGTAGAAGASGGAAGTAAGAAGAGGSKASSKASSTPSSGGCSCALDATRGVDAGVVALLLAVLAVARRRR